MGYWGERGVGGREEGMDTCMNEWERVVDMA